MNYYWDCNIGSEAYDFFVQASPHSNLLQSYNWAKIKDNWNHLYTGVYDDDYRLVAAGLVLIKPLPLGMTMFYIPRGPVLDYGNDELLKFYFSNLKKVAKAQHCIFIKVDPDIHYAEYHIEEKDYFIPREEGVEAIQKLQNLGSIHKGLNKDFQTTVQPRYHMACCRKDFQPELFTRKWRTNMKIAQKSFLSIKIGRTELLSEFTDVMKKTEQRKGVALRDREYYEKLLKCYGEDAFIMLGYFDVRKAYDNTIQRLTQCLIDLKNCAENSKKKRFKLEELRSSLERKKEEYGRELEISGGSICVCGTLTVIYGQTAEILYAGMDEEYRRLMAPYLVWYKTMSYCFERGCETCNMGGVEGELADGLSDFKKSFYPVVNEYVGEFDIPVNHLTFRASEIAYAFLKKLRRRKRT